MEADFHRYHRIDLWPDLASGRLTWRKLRVFLSSLPTDSAFTRSVIGGDRLIPLDLQLAAMSVDALHLWLWANSDTKKRGAMPTPLLNGLMGIESPTEPGRTRMAPDVLLARLKAQAEASTTDTEV